MCCDLMFRDDFTAQVFCVWPRCSRWNVQNLPQLDSSDISCPSTCESGLKQEDLFFFKNFLQMLKNKQNLPADISNDSRNEMERHQVNGRGENTNFRKLNQRWQFLYSVRAAHCVCVCHGCIKRHIQILNLILSLWSPQISLKCVGVKTRLLKLVWARKGCWLLLSSPGIWNKALWMWTMFGQHETVQIFLSG